MKNIISSKSNAKKSMPQKNSTVFLIIVVASSLVKPYICGFRNLLKLTRSCELFDVLLHCASVMLNHLDCKVMKWRHKNVVCKHTFLPCQWLLTFACMPLNWSQGFFENLRYSTWLASSSYSNFPSSGTLNMHT